MEGGFFYQGWKKGEEDYGVSENISEDYTPSWVKYAREAIY